MAISTQIPVSVYLETTYQPDCEYIDGEVLERNVGLWPHARIQWLLAVWVGRHEAAWNIIGSIAQRLEVSPTRIRVPDLVVLRPGPQPGVLTAPPLLIIEILAPDDNYSALQERCQDFFLMGVETVWIIDPRTRSGRICLSTGWVAADRLELAGTPIHVTLEPLFAQLDMPSI